jgi:streptogramin lyase
MGESLSGPRLTLAALFGLILAASASGQIIREFPIPTPNSDPIGIALGPDGALWFAEENVSNKIGRITTAGAITEFPASNPNVSGGITAGPDGNLWFTEYNHIGRITTAGVITEFPTLTSNGYAQGICSGPDGALWFTEYNSSKIGRITTAGVVTEFPILTAFGTPPGITAGPDGALWFTESNGNNIGRITTAGVVTEFAVPTLSSFPYGITAGPDGALWFSEYSGNAIGRITTAGAITEFPVPTPSAQIEGIATGPDGNLWFTERRSGLSSSKIGMITTAGVVTEFPIPTADGEPLGIAAGPDNALWFTESNGIKIGRIPVEAAYYTVTPCRVVDTRGNGFTGAYGPPSLAAHADRTFVIAGQCAIPVGAVAVSFNYTITNPTALGDLRTLPGGGTLPLVSTMNWGVTQTRANNAITPLGLSGDITVHVDQVTGTTVDLIIDVNGYFK